MPRVCMRAELLPPGATLPCGRRERIQRQPVVRGAKCTSTDSNGACSMPASNKLARSTSHLQVSLEQIFLIQMIYQAIFCIF